MIKEYLNKSFITEFYLFTQDKNNMDFLWNNFASTHNVDMCVPHFYQNFSAF
jgi:hypothetical protein